jgi:predicted transglutaminase-like cysteine proteinase
MPLGAPVAAPLAFLDFCERFPAQCAGSDVTAAGFSSGAYDADFWRLALSSYAMQRSMRRQGLAAGTHDRLVRVIEAPARAAADQRRTQLRLTREGFAQLTEVNRAVNATIVDRPDLVGYGVADYWTLPLETRAIIGDCEDFVLEKRRLLAERGFPPEVLSIALVQTPWGGLHAVLLVSTDKGEYALDSLSPWVTKWRGLGYRWLIRQSPSDPRQWVHVAPG